MFRALLFVAVTVLISSPTAWAREPEAAERIQQLADGIANKPPATYFALATELFRVAQKDEAAFWYYVGELRYRAWLYTKPKGTDASEEQYHFWFLSQSVGQSIYENADQRSAILINAIDRALAWDREQPNGYTSKTEFKAQYERARQELLALRERIKEDAAEMAVKPSSGWGLFPW